jgi:hypothetical protein
MTWVIQIPDGPKVESDDFTLDDLDRIEKETGTFWSVMNPLRESKVARAFLKVAYTHADLDPALVDGLTMKTLKGMFDFKADEPEEAEAVPLGRKAPKDRMRKSSSAGARSASNGPQPSQGNNESVTSLVS